MRPWGRQRSGWGGEVGALGGQGGVIRVGWGSEGPWSGAWTCKVRSVDSRVVPWSPRITISAMVEPLDDMPEGTVGFRIDGDVEREDYIDVLVPALKSAIDGGRGLRTLYLIEDLDEIEGGALWEDTKLGYDLVLKLSTTAPGGVPRSSPTSSGWRVRQGCSYGCFPVRRVYSVWATSSKPRPGLRASSEQHNRSLSLCWRVTSSCRWTLSQHRAGSSPADGTCGSEDCRIG